MTLNVPGEYENLLNNAVASGAFSSQEDALRHALDLLAKEQSPSHERSFPIGCDPSEWADRVKKWAAGHSPVDHFVDDSRESIYEGRGL